MREIKFRGLNTKGEWVYGSLVVTTNGIRHKPGTHTKTWIVESAFGNGGWFAVQRRQYVRPHTVGMFTGLYDQNGREIFEGDVVKGRYSDNETVQWWPRGWWHPFTQVFSTDMEVVGNIHEAVTQ